MNKRLSRPVDLSLIKPFPKRKYKYLYSKMLDESIIRLAWKNVRKGKTKRDAVKRIEKNLDEEVRKMRERILNTKPDGYYVEHPELAYEPPKVRRTKIVHENKKKRTAHLADIREQWYFHIIVEVLKPLMVTRIERGICGCIPSRGTHYGKKMVEKSIKNGTMKYFFKADVRHFYDNVRIEDVINKLRDLIDDELFLYCVAKIYKYQKKGILIGLYISPWISNFLLMHIDYTIARIDGVTYIRYVDDFVIMCNNKKTLHKISVLLRYMLGKIHLKLKRNYQVCKFDYVTKKQRIVNGDSIPIRIGRPIDFLGFVFFRDRIIIRKRIMLDAVRMAKKIKKVKQEKRLIWAKLARAMVSRIGWFTHSDTYNCYLKHIKPYVRIQDLKKIISKLDHRESKQRRILTHDRELEERAMCGASC